MNHDRWLLQLRDEVEQELKNILSFWKVHTIDHGNGGFFGRINNENVVDTRALKGSVLHARILWAFASAYNHSKEVPYLEVAGRAYHYIIDYFQDPEFGGAYWTIDEKGRPAETKKQVYASAFVLYGLSAYYLASSRQEVLQHAVSLYSAIVEHAYDKVYGGYFEAFSREWNEISDQRLSGKDSNEKKSANTNLHVVEAFASLYKVWPDEDLKIQIRHLLRIFSDKIIDNQNHHLRLFFDEHWNNKPALISYGHDIEAAWLLLDCAETINDKDLIAEYKKLSVSLTNAAMNGLDADGALFFEYDLRENKLAREKHWWPQAEALVGFINAWQITGEMRYADAALNSWGFIKEYLLNPAGEWYWGIDGDGLIMKEDKVGLWKCPYHNSRACLEVIRRINSRSCASAA